MPDQTTIDAVCDVANATLASERGSNETIRSIADLVLRATTQEAALELPPYSTQPIFHHLQTAMDRAFDTRRAVVDAHLELGKLADRLGASRALLGDVFPCPSFPKGELEASNVRPLARASRG
ncbi:hypothetical protein [Sphingomonas hengshuiensis]|uniref:Uncharacterized protein n=1 Tax=Sphingomonas hengshuiensis TaxID=1609977 RepID=A0A7U4JAS6_9SPHN|nr:hypothetical protein [Sphingomonas hengshuiensis]AJP73397.1 hypothetical protein TS85_18745 [Sphingomonas hengshuiensis]